MHLVIACYHHFASNSGGQVACLANALVDLGAKVTVFVPSQPETVALHGPARFSTRAYSRLSEWLQKEKPRSETTVLLAWTPRENVRRFAQCFLDQVPAPYFVHLEDNETLLTATNLGMDAGALSALPAEEIDRRLQVDDRLAHPLHFPRFIAGSAGITALIDRLAELAPPGHPRLIFWPGYNPTFFGPRTVNLEQRHALGIEDDVTVLTYPGNVHSANLQEVRSLYLATCVLNRKGIRALLVRTGEDYACVLDHTMHEAARYFISLGKLDTQARVADALAMADFLVQPGRAGAFNDYRFPSKLPEFFVTGRPVLLPEANLGRFVRDEQEAIVLKRGDAFEIAERIAALKRDRALCERLSQQAVSFAREHFQWPVIASRVQQFLANSLKSD
jgi:hypothetical protein